MFAFAPKVNAILGRNGMGKTNVLDAIYYICLGKSYFSGQDRYVLQHEASFTRLEAIIQGDNEEKVEVKLIPGKSKEISIDKKPVDKIGDHVGRYPCIVIAPIDVQILLSGSADRRRFINNTVIQYDKAYLDAVMVYNRLLRQRNALLKQMAENRTFNQGLLDAYTEPMFLPATIIHEARHAFCEQLSSRFTQYYQDVSDGNEVATISYKSQLSDDSLSNLMKANMEKDRVLGRTTTGIHKDDITFMLDGKELKFYGSQGQLKSFIISLKLAQYQILSHHAKKKPILLLDDIFDKLDQHRVAHLIRLVLGDDFGQIFITDTSLSLVPDILQQHQAEFHTFEVNQGSIQDNA